MFDGKKKLEQAKGLLDAGLISPEQYHQIQQKVLLELGLVDETPSSPEELFSGNTRLDSSTTTDEGSPFGGPTNLTAEGLVIGQYRLLRLLGQGGMGAVYRARHQNEYIAQRRGDVAIKLIHPHLIQYVVP